MISRQAIEFFEMLSNYRKVYGLPPYQENVLSRIQEKMIAIDKSIFDLNYNEQFARDERESLFAYYQRLTTHLNELVNCKRKLIEYQISFSRFKIENIDITTSLSEGQKFLQRKIDETYDKIQDLSKTSIGCDIVYVPDEIDLESFDLKEGKLYLKSDGRYKSCYMRANYTGNLLQGKHGKPKLDMNNLLEKILQDSRFRKSVLRITAKRKHTSRIDNVELKAKEDVRMQSKPGTITLGIWYYCLSGKRSTIFGHISDGHITVDVCDANGDSHYVSFYSANSPEKDLVTKLLHIPSYHSTQGQFLQKMDDVFSYVGHENGVSHKFVEYQEIVFDCNKNHALNINAAVQWADALLNPDNPSEFNFYFNSCAVVGLSGLLASGTSHYVDAPDVNILTSQEVFDYGKAVKHKLDSLENKLTDIAAQGDLETVLSHLISGSTNSDGVKKMQKLGEKITLEKCVEIVKKRDKGGFLGGSFQHYYSHSHFFGQGRQKWVGQLYDFLRKVDLDNVNSEKNFAKLAEILVTKESEMSCERKSNNKVFKSYSFQR